MVVTCLPSYADVASPTTGEDDTKRWQQPPSSLPVQSTRDSEAQIIAQHWLVCGVQLGQREQCAVSAAATRLLLRGNCPKGWLLMSRCCEINPFSQRYNVLRVKGYISPPPVLLWRWCPPSRSNTMDETFFKVLQEGQTRCSTWNSTVSMNTTVCSGSLISTWRGRRRRTTQE